MTPEDRKRLHQLLDYAIDHDEEYVISQYAWIDLDWHLHEQRYRLHFNISKEEICT